MNFFIDNFEHVCYYLIIEEESYGRKKGKEDY